MALGNRFGINLGEINKAENAIKNARLLRKKTNRAFEKEDAEIEGSANAYRDAENKKTNALAKGSNISETTTPADEEVTTTDSDEEIITAPTKNIDVSDEDETPTREDNIKLLSKQNTLAKIEKANKIKRQFESRVKMYIANGSSEDEARFKAELETKEVAQFNDMFQKSDENEQKFIKTQINDSGNFMASLIKMEDNPQQAEKLYTQRRTARLKLVNELRKKGKNAEADDIESRLKSAPETILNKDGRLNTQYLTSSLTHLTQMIKTAEDNVKESVAETKHMNTKPSAYESGDGETTEITPKKGGGFYKKRKKSNALLKTEATNSSKGGLKTADYDKVRKRIVANLTGMDIDKDDFSMKKLSQTKRDMVTEANAIAERIYKDNFGKITPAEAVIKAKKTKEYKVWKARYMPEKGQKRSKNGIVEIFDGNDWVKNK